MSGVIDLSVTAGARAIHRYARLSASKVRPVLNLIRDEDLELARERLLFCERGAAEVVSKVLESAVSNATNNEQLDPEELYVAECWADEGPVIKRWRARARGRSARINKQTSHVTIIVAQLAESELELRAQRLAASGTRQRATAERAARVAASRAADDSGDEDSADDSVVDSVDSAAASGDSAAASGGPADSADAPLAEPPTAADEDVEASDSADEGEDAAASGGPADSAEAPLAEPPTAADEDVEASDSAAETADDDVEASASADEDSGNAAASGGPADSADAPLAEPPTAADEDVEVSDSAAETAADEDVEASASAADVADSAADAAGGDDGEGDGEGGSDEEESKGA